MTLKISAESAIAACDAIVDLIDVGSGNASLVIYGGAEPVGPESPLTGTTVLVSFDLPVPAFGGAADTTEGATAAIDVEQIDQVQAVADGEATFFRIYNADGTTVMQGNVTAVSGGGDLELSSVNIVTGVDVIIISLTATMPKSAA